MELRQVRVFVAVAEELHFGRAAARLGVVQPAVSQQLSRLERELGLRLLDRGPHRVALTDAGVRLLGDARAVLAAADRVRDAAAELRQSKPATVRLGTAPGLGPRVSRALAAMLDRTPDVEVVLVSGDAVAHAAAIADGRLDLALVRGPVRAASVVAARVGEEPLSVVVPRTHPAARGSSVRLRDLAALPLRLPPRSADPALHDAVLSRLASPPDRAARNGILPGGVARDGTVPGRVARDDTVSGRAAGNGMVSGRDRGWSARLGDAGGHRRGRDVTSVEDAVIEIAAGSGAWTVVYGRPEPEGGACGVSVLPVDPPLSLPLTLIMPVSYGRCHEQVRAAFAGEKDERRPGS